MITHKAETARIEVGKSYVNGWGATIQIVSNNGTWFQDRDGNCYHADGAMAQIAGSQRNNLVRPKD